MHDLKNRKNITKYNGKYNKTKKKNIIIMYVIWRR